MRHVVHTQLATAIALSFLGVASAASGAIATGATPPRHPVTSAAANIAGDEAFMRQAATTGARELALDEIAQRKAADETVRRFATRMVADHRKADAELQRVARREGVSLPAAPDPGVRREQDHLERLSGAQFDAEYMKHQLMDQRRAIDEFRTEAASGRDPELRTFAQRALPTLREHLRLAQAADKAVHNEAGLEAAKDATGATAVAAERAERMPVPKTGM